MTGWFDQLYADRQEWVDSSRKNKFEQGIRQSTVDKYADPDHFVYELLQNAEDQEATHVVFKLSADRLIFEHNGQPFTRQDVENITGLGNSEKPEQANKIGRFGIGFKSVFVVTDAPKIYTTLESEPFGFIIRDLVVPSRIACPDGWIDNGITRFVLDFKTEKAPDLHRDIGRKLRSLGADILLFLRHLNSIQWQTLLEEGTYLCDRSGSNKIINLAGEAGTKGTSKQCVETKYVVFAKQVTLETADRPGNVQIAFRLDGSRIVAEHGQGLVYVYFATKETTGLKFRLHAPFLLTDNRQNIKENCAENALLIKHCSTLLTESLPAMRDSGYLTAECLECLPIRAQSFEGSPFLPLFDAVRHAFKTQELLPTLDSSKKRHVQARNAKISDSRPLRSLLDQKQLTDLYGTTSLDQVCWVSDRIQRTANKDVWDYFINHLEVEEVDSMKFARRITGEFMCEQSDQWIIAFYDFLNDQSALWRARSGNYDAGPLRHKPILRLESTGADNHHVAPFAEDGTLRVYLPTSSATGFPTVKRTVADNEEARKFLLALGLKTPEVVDRVLRVVLPRYQADSVLVSTSEYADDLSAIADAIQTARLNELSELTVALQSSSFIRAFNAADSNKVSYKSPDRVYRHTQDVVTWFTGNPNVWILSKAARDHSDWLHIQKFLGQHPGTLSTAPRVVSSSEYRDGLVIIEKRWGHHARCLNGFDPHADIDGLSYALREINVGRARILWQILLSSTHLISGVTETSTHATYLNSEKTESFSILGSKCRESAWLPNQCGAFFEPKDIQPGDLHDGFDTLQPSYRELAVKLGMSHTEEQEVADKLGVPPDILAALVRAWKHNPAIMDEIKKGQQRAEFPMATIPYSDRRAEKIASEASTAAPKTYELRERSVRTSDPSVHVEAKTALRMLYTNPDGEMVCQICEDPMPFKDLRGEYYFEAVQCLKDAREELTQNYIALCPVCAAKYQYANSTSQAAFQKSILFDDESLLLQLVLAQERHTLHFHEQHLKDLRNALVSLLKDTT